MGHQDVMRGAVTRSSTSGVGVAVMCAKLATNMSRQQWRDWVSPDIDYFKVCPGPPDSRRTSFG